GPSSTTTGLFTRYGTDHHAFVIFPRRTREVMLPHQPKHVTINQITWQVGSLAEVVAGSRYLEERGVHVSRSGRDTPGSNWHTYPYDPDGAIVRLRRGPRARLLSGGPGVEPLDERHVERASVRILAREQRTPCTGAVSDRAALRAGAERGHDPVVVRLAARQLSPAAQ